MMYKKIKRTLKFSCAGWLLSLYWSVAAAEIQLPGEKVSLNLRNTNMATIIAELDKLSSYSFVYSYEKLSNVPVKEIRFDESDIGNILDALASRYNMEIAIQKHTVSVRMATAAGDRSAPSATLQQEIPIRGLVLSTDEPPVPLAGVGISVNGTPATTRTDSIGFYSIKAQRGDVLTFNYLGYKAVRHQVTKAESNLIISLSEDLNTLQEVVVTGMSTQQRRHIASAVGTVNRKNFTDKPITRLSQALQGGATGINVTQGSGLPGGDAATIKIRGVASLLGSAPLVLVDGMVFDMDKVDPATVESITILKDAAAASVYGARAGNGVILITTKRGVAGQVSAQYNAYYGIQQPMYRPDFVDAATYLEMVNEAQRNVGVTPSYSEDAIRQTREGTDPILYPATDWGDLIMREQSPVQEHSFSVSGGNGTARFALSAQYLNQRGMIKQSEAGFQRANVRANTSVNLNKDLLVFMDLFAGRDHQLQPNITTATLFNYTYMAPPNIIGRYPIKPENPDYIYYGRFGEWMNPLANVEQGGKRELLRDEMLINLRPVWNVNDKLSLKGQLGYRVSTGADKQDQETYLFFDYFTDELVSNLGMTKTAGPSNRSSYYYVGASADYTETWKKHRLNLMGGYSQELANNNAWDEIALISIYGKAYYSFDDKYLLEAGIRRDGSSLFAPNKKWGNFPSVAAGWNIDQERFMQRVKFVNQFKLRASYGILGNNNIAPYAYQSVINNANGVELSNGNTNITWEKVGIFNTGADISLLDSRLDLTFDWYNKATDDLIINITPTLTSGLLSGPVNIGKLTNRGYEIGLGYNGLVGADLQWGVNLGYSFNRSKWLKLSQETPIISGNTVRQLGFSISEHYGYKTDGLLTQADIDAGVPMFPGQTLGDIKYLDIDGSGDISENDRVPLGSYDPNITYFANLNFSYKGFDFDAQLNGVGDVGVFYSDRIAIPLNLGENGGTPQKWHMDYWTPDNPDARFPRLTPSPGSNGLFSDFWRVGGAFLRVRYIQAGYDLKRLMKNSRIDGLRIYVNAQNPLTFTSVETIDPETKGNQSTHPMFKTYSMGVNLKF